MIGVLTRGHPAFLASVTNAAEARVALAGGADVIDAKNPATGALGALPTAIVAAIVTDVAGRAPVSATIGDLPADGAIMVPAAQAMAATGVDIVKVGLFGGDVRAAIAALGQADMSRARLFAVLMADQKPDFSVLEHLAAARFLGVMLDTADKASGALPDVLDRATLASFVAQARARGLVCGLAGSLRRAHIAGLAALRPDIIGFRGALCERGRTSALVAANVAAVRADLDAAHAAITHNERSVA